MSQKMQSPWTTWVLAIGVFLALSIIPWLIFRTLASRIAQDIKASSVARNVTTRNHITDPARVSLDLDALNLAMAVSSAESSEATFAPFHPAELIPIVNILVGTSRISQLQASADRVINRTATDEDYAVVGRAIAEGE